LDGISKKAQKVEELCSQITITDSHHLDFQNWRIILREQSKWKRHKRQRLQKKQFVFRADFIKPRKYKGEGNQSADVSSRSARKSSQNMAAPERPFDSEAGEGYDGSLK
jgi:hypothetical protein